MRGSCLFQVVRLLKHGIGAMLRIVYHFFLMAGGVSIGKGTMISLGAKIDLRRGKIYIGDYCTITHGVVILSHDAAAAMLGKKSEDITRIEDHVFVGVNSVILAGITVGRYAIIGAGSVVTSNIPAYSVAMGNPARVVRQIQGDERNGG